MRGCDRDWVPSFWIGSRWRVLQPDRQALLVLVHLRRNETFVGLAAAFGIEIATAHRYVTEVISLLAELVPDLRRGHSDRSTQGLRHPGRYTGTDRPALRRERPAVLLRKASLARREHPVPHRSSRRVDLGTTNAAGFDC